MLSIFGNAQASALWQPDPDGRGTSGLLQQCLLTLGLCVYSALHLNIPHHKSTNRDKIFTKFSWLLIALLAPELVVYKAWSQRREAKAIAAELNKATRQIGPRLWLQQLLGRLRKRRSQPLLKAQTAV